MKILERKNYIDNSLRLLSYFPVLGLIGLRQVGKTTLARLLAEKISKECIYFDLEVEEDFQKLSAEPTLLLKRLENQCVIIDEIQRLPRLFEIMRSLIDQHREPSRFIVLGSASPHLIKNSSESLAGRIAYMRVYPFSFREVPESITLDQLWIRGGFPMSLFAHDEKLSHEWRRNFIRSYLERDLPLLGFPADPVFAARLLRMLASIHGSLLNIDNLSRSLGIDHRTCKKYLNFLESAFLIKTIFPFSTNMKKRLVKSPKVFLTDSGIFHSLLDIADLDDLMGNPMLGNSWEGFIIQQIISLVADDLEINFYRTHQGAEVDLVLSKGMKPLASVEIKYSTAPKLSKGLLQSIDDLGTLENFIIAPVKSAFPIHQNILVVNIMEFLLSHLPLIGKN